MSPHAGGKTDHVAKHPGNPFCIVPQRLIRRICLGGAGDPESRGESHDESVGGAGSFSASPTANPVGRRERMLRYRRFIVLGLALASLAAIGAAPAAGSSVTGSGGQAPGTQGGNSQGGNSQAGNSQAG